MPVLKFFANAPTDQKRDMTLDIFRATAILLVIMYHYTARLPAATFGAADGVALPIVFGWIGVYFFFVLSGYCIFFTLERTPTIWRFFAKRFSRVYPAFAAAAILLFTVDQFAPLPLLPEFSYRPEAPTWTDLLGNLVFLGGFFEWVNGSFWSITVELQFYGLVGICAMVFKNGIQLSRFFHWASMSIALAWLFVFWGSTALEPLGKMEALLRLVIIAPYLPLFALGILGAQLAKGQRDLAVAFKWQLVLAMLIVFSQAAVDAPNLLAADTLLPVVGTLGLLLVFRAYSFGWRLPFIPFVTPSLMQIGLVSYSWYLLHENLGYLLLDAMNPSLPHAVSVLLTICITYVLAQLFAWSFEWRFRKEAEWFAEGILTRVGALLPKKLGDGMA